MNRVPKKPTFKEEMGSLTYVIVRPLLMVLLVVASIHLLVYYLHMLLYTGLFAVESMEIAKYIVLGAFFFLFVYKDIIEKLFKIKEWNKRK